MQEIEIKIERASSNDYDGLQNVRDRSWLVTYPNIDAGISKEDIQDWLEKRKTPEKIIAGKERLQKSGGENRAFVAKHDNKVVGFVVTDIHEDKNELSSIYIDPDYVGHGIGTKLWNEAKKHLDTKKCTFVHVVEYNKNAISFYEKLGFKRNDKKFADEKFVFKSGSRFVEIELEKPAESA